MTIPSQSEEYLPLWTTTYNAPRRLLLAKSHRFIPGKITIKHWQLRDLITVDTHDPSLVYYPCDTKVMASHIAGKNTRAKTVCEFGFEPRAIQNMNRSIAVAGVKPSREQTGVVGVMGLESGIRHELDLGLYINNSVCLYNQDPDESQTDAGLKALVCNNDKFLYWLGMRPDGSFEVEKKTEFTASLNHASISPDKSLVVACGDIEQVYLVPTNTNTSFTFRTSNGRQPPWSTLDSYKDFAFSTAFHPSGHIFGVAYQPGLAQLFDLRNLSGPLAQIWSTRPKDWMGAFRSLKFANGLADLFMVTEQCRRLHVVDLRNFSNHQVVNLPSSTHSFNLGESSSHSPNMLLDGDEKGDQSIRLYSDMVATGDAFPLEYESNRVFYTRTNATQSVPRTGIRELRMDGVSLVPGSPTSTASAVRSPISPTLGPTSAAPLGSPGTMMSGFAARGLSSIGFDAMARVTQQTEHGISGLGYSSLEGGTVIVGTDSGIATWSVDQVSRRTFPDYEKR